MRILPPLLWLSACDPTFTPPEPSVAHEAVRAIATAEASTLIVYEPDPNTLDNFIVVGTQVPAQSDADGNPLPLDLPLASDGAIGRRHGCIVSPTRTVHCWGDHTGGALGAHRACRPPTVEGGQPDCILPGLLMPSLPPVAEIAAGDDITCVILEDDGHVVCWGASSRTGGSVLPSLDPPTPVAISDGSFLVATALRISRGSVCAIDDRARLWCWGDGFGARPQIQPFTGVVDIAFGTRHNCVIDDGGLACWGDNRNAQLGDYARARACKLDAPCTIEQPTKIPIDATRVVVGERHTCVLETTGDVICFGSNEVGQLGRQDAFLVGDLGRVPLPVRAMSLDGGYAHACALSTDGAAWCWGALLSTSSTEI